jgi:hypothetical protein
MTRRDDGDDPVVLGLVGRLATGDGEAWPPLFAALLPAVERRVRGSRSFAGFRRSEDDVREVVTAVFERLRRDDFRALRLYGPWRDKHPARGFADWLTIVTTNVIRDYVSAQLTAMADDRGDRQPIDPGELADGARGGRRRHGSTTLTSVHELVAAAAEKLTMAQQAALDGWLQGYEFDELAAMNSLATGREAEKLVRAALARLRRHVEG